MTNIGLDRIHLPTDTGEWGQPQFWGTGEDHWGLMGWSGYESLDRGLPCGCMLSGVELLKFGGAMSSWIQSGYF